MRIHEFCSYLRRRDDARRLSRMLQSALRLRLNHVHDLAQARAKLRTSRYRVILTEAAPPRRDMA